MEQSWNNLIIDAANKNHETTASSTNTATASSITHSKVEKARHKRPKIWAVGGGKGGVGKSLISANFSHLLAKRGHSVVSIDLDLGGANLHTCLGVAPPKYGVGDWLSNRVKDMRDVIVPTSTAGHLLISGASDPSSVIGAMESRKHELIESLRQLDADHVVIDLGAGTHGLTVDFFNAADSGILSILPEPTSVENAYRFIRIAFYQKLLEADLSDGIREVVAAASNVKNQLGVRVPADLLRIVDRLESDAAAKIRAQIKTLSPHVVINQVRAQSDVDIGNAICSVCRRYFGVNAKYSGYIDYDASVWKAVRARKAAVQEFPRSVLANRFNRLIDNLLDEELGKSGEC